MSRVAWLVLAAWPLLCSGRKHFYRTTHRQDASKLQKLRKEVESPVSVVISGMNLIHPNKRPQRRTFDENLFEDSISFDQDTNFRLHGPGHALTFIFGQALILGVGAIMFASRSLSQASTESRDALAKQQDATMDELTLAVLDKVSRKKRVRKKERKNQEESYEKCRRPSSINNFGRLTR